MLLINKNFTGKEMFDTLTDDFFRSFNPMFEENKNKNFNLAETDDKYTLEFNMLGFEKSDINIELDGNILSIEASKTEKSEDYVYEGLKLSDEKHYQYDLSVFEYSDLERIDSKLENGILSITVYKDVNKTNKKKIEIS